MSNLTIEDLRMLDDCSSYDEWKDATVTVKHRHGGCYPADWFNVMIKGGRANEILARFGMDTAPRMTTLEPGEDIETARKRLEVPAHPLVQCRGCGRFPDQIDEFVEMAEDEPDFYKTPTAAAKSDGTYNRTTGKLWCSMCYIKHGRPLGKA